MMRTFGKKNKLLFLFFIGVMCCTCILGACKEDDIDTAPNPQSSDELVIENINTNVKALRRLIDAKKQDMTITSYNPVNNGDSYTIELSNGTSFSMYTQLESLREGDHEVAYSPKIGTRMEGSEYYWTIDDMWLTFGDNKKVRVINEGDTTTPIVGIDDDDFWTVEYNGKLLRLEHKVESGKLTSQFRQLDLVNERSVSFTFSDRTAPIVLYLSDKKPNIPVVKGSIRRPISYEHPTWFVHIDTWNFADPQKIIDLIPEDIRPYVIFNISMSIGRKEGETRFHYAEYGYEIAKSWLRTCAENNVWAMVQPSSGGYCHFPDYSSYEELKGSVYEEFFRDYPNFLGFNYAEQFWGFDDYPLSGSWLQRVAHWTQLLKLSHEYGGYLTISFCSLAADINPIALVKRNPDFAEVAQLCSENFIMCEKYTSQSCFFNTESICLGTWLSGYAGNYGIRFDQCGWTQEVGQNGDIDFPPAAGALPIIEHAMLTGQTVIDGPELIWAQCFKEVSETSNGGYKSRQWECYPQFINISMDLFRKIIDGTIRIPSREEVIDRSKLVILQDVYSGDNNAQYSASSNLHEGLYLRDGDGNREENHCYFKKTGRYPTIPVAFQLCDDVAANSFQYKINQSTFDGTLGNIPLKVAKFNSIFPEEYTGELFAGRVENSWVVYNGLAGMRNAVIPLKYNTCDKMELSYSKYTVSVVKEYADKITFYMNNYDVAGSKKTDVIKVFGCKSTPSFSLVPRAQGAATVSESFKNGVYTLNVVYNGPLDLTVNCSGNATNRESEYTVTSVSLPAPPQIYMGAHQYEAEFFDVKDVAKVVKLGYDEPIRNFTSQGYINFGANASAAVRDEITALEDGQYTFYIRYRSPFATVNTVDMYVNGNKVDSPNFVMTDNDNTLWSTISLSASLKKGKNTFELKANSSGAGDLYLDNIVVEKIN